MQNAVEKAVNARRSVLNKEVVHEIEDPSKILGDFMHSLFKHLEPSTPKDQELIQADLPEAENLDSKLGHNIYPRLERIRQLDGLIKSKEVQFKRIQREITEVELNTKKNEILKKRQEISSSPSSSNSTLDSESSTSKDSKDSTSTTEEENSTPSSLNGIPEEPNLSSTSKYLSNWKKAIVLEKGRRQKLLKNLGFK